MEQPSLCATSIELALYSCCSWSPVLPVLCALEPVLCRREATARRNLCTATRETSSRKAPVEQIINKCYKKKKSLVPSFLSHIFPRILTPRGATLRSRLYLHYLPFLRVQKLPLWNDCLGLFEPENPFWVDILLPLLQFSGIYPSTSFQVCKIRKDFPGRQNIVKRRLGSHCDFILGEARRWTTVQHFSLYVTLIPPDY